MQHNTARQSDRQEIDRFGALPLSLLANPDIDPTAKVLLAILAAHMGPKGAWPGISTLAAGVGRDTSTVRRQLCELADLGLLDWSHEMRGGRRLCVYRFTFDRFGGLGLVKTRQLQAEPVELQAEPVEPVELQAEPVEPVELQAEPVEPVEPVELQAEPVELQRGAHGCTVYKEQRTNPPNPPLTRGAVRAGERIEPGSIRLGRAERQALDGQQDAVGETCYHCRELIGLENVGLVWSTWGDAIPAVVRIRRFDDRGNLRFCRYIHHRCMDVEQRTHTDYRGGPSW